MVRPYLCHGFKGSGYDSCRPEAMCDTGNGGCDELVKCKEGSSGTLCGPCPAGYSGTGDTSCVEVDACALRPCFPGVACTDLPPPSQEEGFVCGACPEGLHGDGLHCQLCTLAVHIASSTAVDGVIRRVRHNKVVGEVAIDPAECVNTQGITFKWYGTIISDTGGLPLCFDDDANQANTLHLNIPADSLEVNRRYTVKLVAELAAAPEVRAAASLSFFVSPLPLVVLISGSGSITSSSNLLRLDATPSFDPNGGGSHTITFTWSCTSSAGACRTTNGTVLPERIHAGGDDWACEDAPGSCAVLALTLLGSEEGIRYDFTCTASKGKQQITPMQSSERAWALVYSGSAFPSVVLYPMLRVNPDVNIIINGSVLPATGDGSLSVLWEDFLWDATAPPASRALRGEQSLPLESITLTPVTQPTLVVRANTLTPRAVFTCKLVASESVGSGSSELLLNVNGRPFHAGKKPSLEVSPFGRGDTAAEGSRRSAGLALEDSFLAVMAGWEDDPEDLPLQYLVGGLGMQISYEVVGKGDVHALTESLPSTEHIFTVPEPGLEVSNYEVVIHVNVSDMLGATATASSVIEVYPKVFNTSDEEQKYVTEVLERGGGFLLDGDLDSVLRVAQGVAARLNVEAESQHQGNRPAQRLAALDLVAAVAEQRLMTDALNVRLASITRALVMMSEQLNEEVVGGALEVARTLAADRVTLASAEIVCDTLSLLMRSTDNATAQTATVEVAKQLADGMAVDLVPGQDSVQAQLVTCPHTMKVSYPRPAHCPVASWHVAGVLSLGCRSTHCYGTTLRDAERRWPASKARTRSAVGAAVVVADGSGLAASLTLPRSVFPILPEETRTTIITSRLDHHNGAAPVEMEAASGISGITLADHTTGIEVNVMQLQQALTLTLPLEDVGTGSAAGTYGCWWWSEQLHAYTEEGCAAIPLAAPPAANLFWSELNVSALSGKLEQAWVFGNASQMAQCTEEYDAVYPEYDGADAGHRKYIGDKCHLAEEDNSLGCWWVWQRGRFEGPDCVQALYLDCLCTHLTEFGAMQDIALGEVSEPPQIQIIDVSTLGDMSAQDVAESGLLLTIVASFMGFGLLGWLGSNYFHSKERAHIITSLLDPMKNGGFIPLKIRYGFSAKILLTWTIREGGVFFGHRHSKAGAKGKWKLTSQRLKGQKVLSQFVSVNERASVAAKVAKVARGGAEAADEEHAEAAEDLADQPVAARSERSRRRWVGAIQRASKSPIVRRQSFFSMLTRELQPLVIQAAPEDPYSMSVDSDKDDFWKIATKASLRPIALDHYSKSAVGVRFGIEPQPLDVEDVPDVIAVHRKTKGTPTVKLAAPPKPCGSSGIQDVSNQQHEQSSAFATLPSSGIQEHDEPAVSSLVEGNPQIQSHRARASSFRERALMNELNFTDPTADARNRKPRRKGRERKRRLGKFEGAVTRPILDDQVERKKKKNRNEADVFKYLDIPILRVQLCVPFYDMQEVCSQRLEAPVILPTRSSAKRSRIFTREHVPGVGTGMSLAKRASLRHEDTEMEQCLSFERMLGTAMMHACFCMTTLVDKEQVPSPPPLPSTAACQALESQ
ncbi:hypothetical protein CYMTET_29176 [Cymbomonas tetramitiformis]|uniref:EGF-like domain-containing protein n=1 Tax=Cymbomonas tetramitiformis TaxID=36881 RepID=A0AAE0FN08_9CHLO|nr:hypothetical protein CYMTET_29176 [Cymbomonas tetramitiformis]